MGEKLVFSVPRGYGSVIRCLGICTITTCWLIGAVSLPSQGREGIIPTEPVATVAEWGKPLGGAWKVRPLREMTRTISETQQVEILLDRRIDPDREIDFTATGKSAKEEVRRLAQQLGVGVSVFGSVAYIGPAHAARVLQTLIVLRKEELIPRRRSPVGAWMFEQEDLGWQDLEKPREIVQRWIASVEMTVTNPELIPHDRWAGAKLEGVTPFEALSLVLIQWDLTFEVDASKKLLTLKPIPEIVEIERQLGVIKVRAPAERQQELQKLQQDFTDVELSLSGQRLKGKGLWEDLRMLEDRLNGVEKPIGPAADPLKDRKYTFRLKDVPLTQFMEEMGKEGVVFDYDAEEFRKKGIDLQTAPEIDVESMGTQELFEKMFGPLGLSVELDGLTVRLRVK